MIIKIVIVVRIIITITIRRRTFFWRSLVQAFEPRHFSDLFEELRMDMDMEVPLAFRSRSLGFRVSSLGFRGLVYPSQRVSQVALAMKLG